MSPEDPKNPGKERASEPTSGFSTVPMWLVFIFGGLFYWSLLFMDQHAAGFNSEVYVPFPSYDDLVAANPSDPDAKLLAEGRADFEKICAACHQSSGTGKEGLAPPLAGSEWVQAAGGNRIAHIVLNGLTGPVTVKGKEWNLTMPPWRDTFTDYQFAAILSYVRSQWGNNASRIKPDLIKAARADKHPSQYAAQELLKLPVQ